jgi:hypothetical protein
VGGRNFTLTARARQAGNDIQIGNIDDEGIEIY